MTPLNLGGRSEWMANAVFLIVGLVLLWRAWRF